MSGCVAKDQRIIVQRESVGISFAGMRLHTATASVTRRVGMQWGCHQIARSFQRVLNGGLFGAKVPHRWSGGNLKPERMPIWYHKQ